MNECFSAFLMKHTPYILIENEVVVGVGNLLLEQLGYESNEIVGSNELEILDLFLGSQNKIQSGNDHILYLLFTKEGATVFYNIHICENVSGRQRLYVFQRKEKLSIKQDINIIHQLISNSPFGMAVFSVPDNTLINANQPWLNRLDEPFNQKENSIGKHIGEIVTGWKGSIFENIWNAVLTAGKACHLPEYRYSRLKKGISFWNMSLTPIFEDKKLIYFVEITYDVTETILNRDKIRMQKDQLFKQFQQFETVVENMSDALFIIYPDSNAISLNQEALHIKHLFHDFQSVPEFSEEIKYYDTQENEMLYEELPVFKILKGKQYKAFRVTVKTAHDIFHFSISGRPVYDNKKNIYFSIVCIRDDTSQVNHDNYILRVEKEKKAYLERAISLKDDFLTLVSHEFKTPLTVIGTAIQAMELFCGKELSERAKRYIETIKQNSLRQLRLVSNLLDITRSTVDQIRLHRRNIDIVSLTRMITESVKIYAAQKELTITFISEINIKHLYIDDEKYERILLNILSNAIKFTPKGKSVQVKLYTEDDYVGIEVADEGVGIPQDKIDVIFERFGQVDSSLSRQAEGSGIGLFLVKMFVERMGGSISVTSAQFVGTTFVIKLPDKDTKRSDFSDEPERVDNKRIVRTMNIEFSDIYLSK